eukprot:4119403-Amphidinium_carterae.1
MPVAGLGLEKPKTQGQWSSAEGLLSVHHASVQTGSELCQMGEKSSSGLCRPAPTSKQHPVYA